MEATSRLGDPHDNHQRQLADGTIACLLPDSREQVQHFALVGSFGGSMISQLFRVVI